VDLDRWCQARGGRPDVCVERGRRSERLEHRGRVGERHRGERIGPDGNERLVTQLVCARDEQVAELGVAAPGHDVGELVG